MMNIQPIEGSKHLVRDKDTGAVLNINTEIPAGLKLAKLNSGIYFVQLLYENTFKSIKFVIKLVKVGSCPTRQTLEIELS